MTLTDQEAENLIEQKKKAEMKRLKQLDGTKLVFVYPLWTGAEKVMAELSQSQLLATVMVGSVIAIITLDGVPAKFIKNENGQWIEMEG